VPVTFDKSCHRSDTFRGKSSVEIFALSERRALYPVLRQGQHIKCDEKERSIIYIIIPCSCALMVNALSKAGTTWGYGHSSGPAATMCGEDVRRHISAAAVREAAVAVWFHTLGSHFKKSEGVG
jgi:hypothetical protein